MKWSRKTVAITGGTGFIGSHIVEKLIGLGANVIIIDKAIPMLYDFELSPIVKCVDLAYDPLSDIIMALWGADIVFHLAAVVGGRGFINNNPALCCESFAINQKTIKACQHIGVESIHFSSSACVYPTSLQSDYDVDNPLKEDEAFEEGWGSADLEYGWAKLMGEMTLHAFHKQYGLEGSIVRYVTAYGPREDNTHAIIALLEKAIRKQDPYIIWGSGFQKRDFTYVDDIVSGTILAAEKITDFTPINLGEGKPHIIQNVANMIFEVTGHHPENITFDKSKPEGVANRILDVSRAKKLLGWKTKVSLMEGIRRTYNYLTGEAYGA